ncbi:MAG: hypothetical protein EPN70_10255 [Paraburkholderia sp.]|uniref:hypothetical protein n=1 Tax=Paraburkholderia sp. TaxID=1926495 RepID=UPI0011F6DDAF|nr:hypothetical protein [Paraburkholderia sp.]TAM04934.1 MAG: hypothetical protein EPN70_10255 [Paraburkholderia sp.]TAM29562.1 MAG: hypothetical protein EPN59_11460 [Paraburkholderia sp.]
MKMKRIFLPTAELYLSPIYCIAMGARLHGIDVSEAELLTIYPVGKSGNREDLYFHIAESLGLQLNKVSIDEIDPESSPGLYLLINKNISGALVDARSVEMPVVIYRPNEGKTIAEQADFSDFAETYLIHKNKTGKIIPALPSTPHFYTLKNESGNFENLPSTGVIDASHTSIDVYIHYKRTSIEAHILDPAIKNLYPRFCKEYLQSIHSAYFKHFDNQAGIFRSNSATRNNLPFAAPHRIDSLLEQLFENLKRPEELKHLETTQLAEIVA